MKTYFILLPSISISLRQKHLFICFRSVTPSGNNVASRNLSQKNNDFNIRKVHVNAQVTAMITLLESLYLVVNITYAMLNQSTIGNLIVSMPLRLIILPYSFLMNTSHNKGRIIELGWKNVLRNILHGCNSENSQVKRYDRHIAEDKSDTFETPRDTEFNYKNKKLTPSKKEISSKTKQSREISIGSRTHPKNDSLSIVYNKQFSKALNVKKAEDISTTKVLPNKVPRSSVKVNGWVQGTL